MGGDVCRVRFPQSCRWGSAGGKPPRSCKPRGSWGLGESRGIVERFAIDQNVPRPDEPSRLFFMCVATSSWDSHTWPFVAPRRSVPGDVPSEDASVVCSGTLEIESPQLPLSQPSHINTTRGDFPRNFLQPLKRFISHCLPAPLGSSTVKAAANTGCFSPRIPQLLLSLPLHVGKLELAGYEPLGQGIRSVSQLVKQVSGGDARSTQPSLLGRHGSVPSPWLLL